MRAMTCVAVLALAVAIPASVDAGLRAFRKQRMVMGEDAAVKTEHLLGLGWETSLDAALAKAKAADRMVFWVHLLGCMDGPT